MKSTHRLFLKLLAALMLLAAAGCASIGEYPASRGAGLPDEQVGIFHLSFVPAFVESIKSNEDDSLEVDYSHPFKRSFPFRLGEKGQIYDPVRLLPGEYRIDWRDKMRGKASGAIYVRIKAGHVYEFMYEDYLWGDPNRVYVWVEDITSGRSVSEKQKYYWYRYCDLC